MKMHLYLYRKGYDSINSENKITENKKCLNIARNHCFKNSDVFGKYVQTDTNNTFYGRHLIPARTLSCFNCLSLNWDDEKGMDL